MPFHNTIDAPEDKAKVYNKEARTQEQIILAYFRRYPHWLKTPFDVHKALFDDRTPVTSVRRAMTDLTKSGHLIKTKNQRPEKYGKVNYLWQYNTEKGGPNGG